MHTWEIVADEQPGSGYQEWSDREDGVLLNWLAGFLIKLDFGKEIQMGLGEYSGAWLKFGPTSTCQFLGHFTYILNHTWLRIKQLITVWWSKPPTLRRSEKMPEQLGHRLHTPLHRLPWVQTHTPRVLLQEINHLVSILFLSCNSRNYNKFHSLSTWIPLGHPFSNYCVGMLGYVKTFSYFYKLMNILID